MARIRGDGKKNEPRTHVRHQEPAATAAQRPPPAEIPDVPLPAFVPRPRPAKPDGAEQAEDGASAEWSDWVPPAEQELWHYQPPDETPPDPPKGQWWSGWLPDPRHRHQYRFFDGVNWTDHVADDGVAGIDPVIHHRS